MKTSLITLFGVCVAILMPTDITRAAERPNVLVFLMDDMGYV